MGEVVVVVTGDSLLQSISWAPVSPLLAPSDTSLKNKQINKQTNKQTSWIETVSVYKYQT